MGLRYFFDEAGTTVLLDLKFYGIHDPRPTRSFRGTPETDADAVLLFSGRYELAEPVVIRHAMGAAKPGEVVWTDGYPIVAISSRVVEALREFSGWSTYPVRVIDRNGVEAPGYSGLSVVGRSGPLEAARAIRTTRMPAGTGFAFYKGVYFDPDSWDGSDLFLLSGGVRIVATERVRNALERLEARNLRFVPLPEDEFVLPA